ncbi:MAG: hypothetical protein ACI9GM_001052, partial [Salibacteraceae bacterium]
MKHFILIFSLLFTVTFAEASVWVVDSLANTGYGSLRAACDSAVSNDTIRFNPNLIANGSDSIVLTSQIYVQYKSLNIIGLYTNSDTLFLSGGQTNRLFYLHHSPQVTLDSLICINGYVNSLTGAGGIYLHEVDSVTVRNSFFQKNTVNPSYSAGAIRIRNITNTSSLFIEMENVRFMNNSAYGGGCAYVSANQDVTFIMLRCTFEGNYTGGLAGGVSIYSGSSMSKVNVKNCDILSNSSGGSGFIHVYSGDHSVFEFDSLYCFNNTGSNGAVLSLGGGINSKSTVINSVFDTNSVGVFGNGGAIYSTCEKNRIENNVFTRNIAEKGAGIYCVGDTNIIVNNDFIGNTGDVITAYGCVISLVDSCLFNDNAGGVFLGKGGSVCEPEFRVSNSKFNQNDNWVTHSATK